MGGLVVKKAVILGHQQPEFHEVANRVCTIIFLGTPHQGAAIAQILKRLLSFVAAPRPFVEDLLPHSPVLQAINEDFPRVSVNYQLLSFFETRPMTIGIYKGLIVEKNDAVMNVSNERRTLLDADHRNIAMYGSPNESAYVAVRNALATIVESQRNSTQSQLQSVLQGEQAALDKFLNISDAPEDDLMNQDSIRLPGSCEWLTNKMSYERWKGGFGARILWLRGRPGAGKSVLSGHIINELRQNARNCCFFFFSAGDSTKSSVNGFLRSMAWQMAVMHPEIFAKIAEISEDWKALPIDQVGHLAVWRRIFTPILKLKLKKTQYWVIDAIDECKGTAEVISYLGRIQEHWPISILITSRDGVEAHLTDPNLEIQTEFISDDDTKHDISLFLEATVNFLPCVPLTEWDTPGDMADYILRRSGGCFLWVHIVCTELREVSTLTEIEKVLHSTPLDMDALYTKILEDMTRARFSKTFAKSVLTWVAYSFRPLNTEEIRDPIEMDIGDKIDNDVERSITKACGKLVFIDTYSRVQLVHSTAREFLTRKDIKSEYIVPKTEGHGRLALICFNFLVQKHESNTTKSRRISDTDAQHRIASTISPFTNYACNFVFQHLNLASSKDYGLFTALAKFLNSTTVLKWIEYIATNGELHTIFQAGVTINALLKRRAQHSPPIEFANGHMSLLQRWGDDLIHLVTKFSRWLRLSPSSIHLAIPPFCPPSSAIRRQFASGYRGINVRGLSTSTWDDCLTTIVYPKGTKPNVVASGQGFFAVGTIVGKVMVYDDSIFQEVHVLNHREPVWRLAFAEKEKKVASAGAHMVRIWSSDRGLELMNFTIPSLCLSLTFTDSDSIIRATTSSNRLLEWDLISGSFLDDPVDWTVDFETEAPSLHLRTPSMAACSAAANLMSVVYRGEDIMLWDYNEDRIHDFYAKDIGSRGLYGPRKFGGAPTVRAITFGTAVDTDRLAATYTDGDLVIFDMDDGRQLAKFSRANTMLLASSHDGRTLAGVDSHGNLTLFDFESLRPLYKVQFETAGMAKGLAFTADNLRFIELRGEQCRVWEPSVLLRQDSLDEENSDTVSISTGPQEVDYQVTRVVNITSIAYAEKYNLVICGKEDGSIHVYEISGEPESQQLPIQSSNSPISMLCFDEDSSILASCDMSGRVKAWKITKRLDPRQPNMAWDVGDTLVNTLPAGTVKQILLSGKCSRLLISSERYDTLWPIPKAGEGVWIGQARGSGKALWLKHSFKSDCLILAQDQQFEIYKWSNLEKIHTMTIATDVQSPCYSVERVVPLQSRHHFVTIAESPSRQIQLWEFEERVESGDYIKTPARDLGHLSSKIEMVVGTFGSRLVVCTSDFWVASLDLWSKALEDTFIRHFFIPSDWLSVSGKLTMGIGKGEILFAKQAELAIIKRGLDVTEAGSSFNPRRQSRQKRLPVRPPVRGAEGTMGRLHSSPL